MSDASNFGIDPLGDNSSLQVLRERSFVARGPTIESAFQNVVHGNHEPFYRAICSFVAATEDIVRQYK